MEQRIKGTTGLLALIGSPVGHSGSPDMYNFCFRYHNLDYCYMAFDIKEDQVPAALDAMRLFNMRGCNVTMPCKTAAAQNMDELSDAARIIGAVNTIVNENGKLVGHMTDGIGFVENLRDHGVDVKGKKMVVLGAGGAATAIQVQCALDGAASISIFNPNDPFLDRAKNTAAKLKKEVPDCDVQVFCIEDQDKLKEEIAKADILVNGTMAGMKPHEDVSGSGSMRCCIQSGRNKTPLGSKRSRLCKDHRRKRHASVAGSCSLQIIYRPGYASRGI